MNIHISYECVILTMLLLKRLSNKNSTENKTDIDAALNPFQSIHSNLLSMNPFEELIAQTTENEMTRSQSFDLSNSGSMLFQSRTQISSVSTAIGNDPARMTDFLGYQTLQNKPTQKLETIYENLPVSKLNFSSPVSSNFRSTDNKDQQSSDKKIISVRGSVSSWNL